MEVFENRRRKPDAGKTRKSLSSIALRALEATAELFGKELSGSELEIWTSVLHRYPDSSVDWACATWQRNGKFFPKPSEILELIQSFMATQSQPQKCEQECQRRHGKGYHTNDVNWLFKRYLVAIKDDPKANLTDLLDELDSKRQGGAPEWRKVGGTAAKAFVGEPIRDEEIPF